MASLERPERSGKGYHSEVRFIGWTNELPARTHRDWDTTMKSRPLSPMDEDMPSLKVAEDMIPAVRRGPRLALDRGADFVLDQLPDPVDRLNENRAGA